MVLLLLFACGGDPKPLVDADGDGWFAVADCDDADPSVHPDTIDDNCDGRDDDCDGRIDENHPEAQLWFIDGDADGYGDFDHALAGCAQPAGYAPNSTDCDDADPTIHPAAADDQCDGVDTNCNGAVDEAAPNQVTSYLDADGDGEGDPDQPVEACDVPDGYVTRAGDCDDDDPDVRPGGSDTTCDTRDEDCDGFGDPGCDTLEIDLSWLSTSTITGSPSMHGEGLRLADLDGDGELDLLATDPNSDGGTIWLFEGSLSGEAGTIATGIWTGLQPELGMRSAVIPDRDGDGAAEVALSTLDDDYRGSVLWVSGSHAGIRDLEGASAWHGPETGDELGAALATISDHDGSGEPALLISAPYAEDGAGRVWVLAGPPETHPLDEAITLTGSGVESHDFGVAIDASGDVDGDGLPDLLVGAPDGERTEQAVFLYAGPLDTHMDNNDATITFLHDVSDFSGAGRSVQIVPDLNHDGLSDLVIGAPYDGRGGEDAGLVYVWTAPPRGEHSLADATALLVGPGEGCFSGDPATGSEDIDGDGLGELWVDASSCDEPGEGIYLVLGPFSGTVAIAPAHGAQLFAGRSFDWMPGIFAVGSNVGGEPGISVVVPMVRTDLDWTETPWLALIGTSDWF